MSLKQGHWPWRAASTGILPVTTEQNPRCLSPHVNGLNVYVLGWQVADHLQADLALDALEMAIWTRRHENIDGLVHHSDRGVQYTSIRYAKRLEDAGAVRSVGSKGDSYDNAAAESLNSLYKRELIDLRGDWQGADDVMVATADWVRWYNEVRIHSYSADMPPKMYEEIYYKALASGKLGSSSQT